ncbi:[Fe-Fe] hydrogenase large subunit C-terminal domain-containing protein [Halocella sp. SP3-1]|uniref:[Fe-Fe] hydrogenase large subunit C-terminal domain-containing protein n=1 Tax=Halocella sp. SP3-1 TaxID=2382161 RepID=UPI000F74FD10|nr:[Fe-Fe] hydrogenase large subunit C-terminal domain-containing protein [Halocella sp. SP3-1]AZO96295.1 histidine kinase [Halocella sp. SP3-1]
MAIILTSEAKCKDCYKCIRHCPLKAIGLNDDQAWVIEERCILCGRCIEICPQNAKTTVSAIDILDKYLLDGEKIAVSLAPSYLAATTYQTPWKLVAGLKELGIAVIEETALAAEIVSREYYDVCHDEGNDSLISSCCPTIVSLIEKNFHSLIDKLSPVMSPMMIHARLLREKLGEDYKIIFIGPCFSKKEEISWDEDNPLDAVLTFEEIIEFFKDKGIEADSLADIYPDCISSRARAYPLHRGILEVAGIKGSLLGDVITVSGVEEAIEVFKDMEEGLISPRFVEALGCKGGCIGGPAMANDYGVAHRKMRLSEFIEDTPRFNEENDISPRNYQRKYRHYQQKDKLPSEEEIREILALTGKFTPEDESNCGGCGYSSCREKAVAVYNGRAEVEMCIPYMREKAESLSHAVVDSSLNGIIIVNEDMIIQEFNPTAEKMFNRKGIKPKGKYLSSFVDPADYIEVRDNQEIITDKYKEYEQYSLITRESIYPLEKYGVVIGLITDVTAEEKRKAEIDDMKLSALNKAKRVIREQMKVAQQIAGLLGESTAETKATLLELIDIMNRKEANTGEDES